MTPPAATLSMAAPVRATALRASFVLGPSTRYWPLDAGPVARAPNDADASVPAAAMAKATTDNPIANLRAVTAASPMPPRPPGSAFAGPFAASLGALRQSINKPVG
jgi:hypothetical protein